jgi:hypothetical protein
MSNTSWTTRNVFPLIVMIWLLTLIGVRMMLRLQLFSPPTLCLSLPLSLWVLALYPRCVLTYARVGDALYFSVITSSSAGRLHRWWILHSRVLLSGIDLTLFTLLFPVYEFLSRLRKKFDPQRVQLCAHGHVPISKVLPKLHAEETHLWGAGLLEVPYVSLLEFLSSCYVSAFSLQCCTTTTHSSSWGSLSPSLSLRLLRPGWSYKVSLPQGARQT